MKKSPDFAEVFEELKSIFKPYLTKMDVSQDTDTSYWLNTRYLMRNKQPLAFGGVRKGKNYVSFHLMSVYLSPELMNAASSELKKRMQGKSCFNFTEVDKKLFSELKTLTKDGATKFANSKFIEQLRMIQDRK